MPEDQPRAGDIGERRLVNLLKRLGWSLLGDTNIDIKSGIPGDSSTYGVDGYMTYFDPYRGRHRGILLESKNYSWENYASQKMNKFFTDTLSKVEGVPESDEFNEKLNFGQADLCNAGLLGIWTKDQENYDHDKFKEYISDISVPRKRRKAYQLLVLGHENLKRLADLQKTYQGIIERNQEAEFDFYYPSLSDSDSARLPHLTMEYLFSDYVFAKLEGVDEVQGDQGVSIVFTFEEMNIENLRFMYQALRRYQMVDADKVWVYPYHDPFHGDSIKQQFRRDLADGSDGPSIDFKPFETVGDFRHLEGEI